MKLFGRNQAILSRYINGTYNRPELVGNSLVYDLRDLKKSGGRTNSRPKPCYSTLIKPFGLEFNWSGLQVRASLHRPHLVIRDDLFIRDREIWVYKRMVREFRSTTQIHLIHNRVAVVCEEIRKPVYQQEMIFPKILKNLGIDFQGPSASDTDCVILEDGKGNFLVVEEDITIRIRMQNREF